MYTQNRAPKTTLSKYFLSNHSNPCWRYYELTEEGRIEHNLAGLKNYLPADDGSNRDVGRFDPATQWMRFGAKHNDIYPIIGDMLRWQIGLPSRHNKNSEINE